MKKMLCQFFVMVLVVCTIVPCAANAVEARAMSIVPGLSFSGNTAYCDVTISCDYSSDRISATMKLWEGNFCIATWTSSGTGSLSMDKSYSGITTGLEYTVTVDAVINNVAKPRVHVKRTAD